MMNMHKSVSYILHGIIMPDYIELVIELEILILLYIQCTSTHLAMQHRGRPRT